MDTTCASNLVRPFSTYVTPDPALDAKKMVFQTFKLGKYISENIKFQVKPIPTLRCVRSRKNSLRT